MPTLFDPVEMGALSLPNRIIMAPLTRGRATREAVPTPIMAEHYAQRASAGLIISEATGISREGLGWPFAPGLWTDEQVEGWKPVVAAVNGVAAGAGMSLALACDMRIAGTSARMTTAFANMGFSGDFGGHYFLARLLGPAKARELYFTSAKLDSAQMDKLGLVNRLVPDDQLRAETMALARQLGQGPRVAWRYMKRNMKIAEEGTLAEALDAEAIGMMRTRETADHQEALRAFMEKRPPVFQGK